MLSRIILVVLLAWPCAIHAQLDPSWTLTVGGQTVQAVEDGSFRIPNISSPDLNADFIADDYVRLTGYSLINGNTQYVYSDYFKIESGQTVIVPELIFTPFAPPNPESIQLGIAEGSSRVLTQIGQTTQLQVLGKFKTLPENCSLVGDSCDLTSKLKWTTYRSSNPKIASVNSDGLVTANGCGIALITAKNDGVTSVTKITISDADELTTVEGFVFDISGAPAVGAIIETQFGHEVVADENGYYSIEEVPAELGDIYLEFELPEPLSRFCKGPIKPVLGGITDAGIVTFRDNFPGPTVNLHTRSFNEVRVSLTAGRYIIIPISPADGGQFTAMHWWGRNSGCDANGRCRRGWIIHYRYSTSFTGNLVVSGSLWSTAEVAFNMGPRTLLDMPEDGEVRFWFEDSLYSDNLGGTSLRILPCD